jgi:rhodanese-related sulfurtransferase
MFGSSRGDPVEDAKSRVKQVSAAEVLRDRKPDTVLLDVREPKEWNMAHIPGAILVPLGELEAKVEAAVPRDSSVVVYCASGNRSAVAADVMQEMGYSDVASMAGGIRGWADAGGEVE